MPDIGLLQGPPRPRIVSVPQPGELPPAVVADEAVPAPELLAAPDERPQVAARAAVVSSERPAVLSVPVPEVEVALESAVAGAERAPVFAAVPTGERLPEPMPEREPEPVLAEIAVAAAATTSAPVASSVSLTMAAPIAPPISAAEAPPASTASSRPLAPPPQTTFARSPVRIGDLLWLLLALVIIVGTGLGIRDPWPADEPRFASLARDMAHSGEWLFPRVGGDLYQDKPPLFFWLLAICHSLFGAFKGWFLIPSFLAAGGILFLVYDFGRRTVSREMGLAGALLVLCSLQFVLATRGAQIDPTLCLLTTFAVYALLRHLLLGDGWRWYVMAGFSAGLGVFTKGVGFLPLLMLIPFFLLRGFSWKNLAPVDAGRGGWRWWLAPLAMLLAISMWFVPMLVAVANNPAEYAAYRDEILFKQTVGRYASAWHHVKSWYYFLVEVIPPLWLPWSILLFWLVPRYKTAFQARDARVWLPLGWVLLVVLFFSSSPGKRGIYILPALPVLAMASLPLLQEVLARQGVRIAGYVLAIGFFVAALALAIGHAAGAGKVQEILASADLDSPLALYVYLLLCGLGLGFAFLRAPLLAWPAALAALTITFSYFIAPSMNGERSGADFVRDTLSQVQPDEQLGLVAYKEQYLLHLDRDTVNFGHRRWQEGPQEAFDAAAWLNAAPNRVLLVPEDNLKPRDSAITCFAANITEVGRSSRDHWFLVRGPAASECASKGDANRAINYPHR